MNVGKLLNFFSKIMLIACHCGANVPLTMVSIVASCAMIRLHRMTGFAALYAYEPMQSVMLSIVAGSGGCLEKSIEKGVLAVERWTMQLYA